MRRILALATIALASLTACEATAPTSTLQLLVADEDPVALEVGFVDGPFGTPPGTDPRARWLDWPESVVAGRPFTVTVRTAGSSCRSAARTDLSVADAGRTLIVVPHDAPQDVEMCTSDLTFLERQVTLQFDTPGTATIVLRGRYFYEGDPAEQVVTVEVR
ncbi:MAG: hypothetical protein KF689_03080 [Gemmatimonadaceae bacterium]|nr:hypothetical protein [Gemmatimonadaceae bacterium]